MADRQPVPAAVGFNGEIALSRVLTRDGDTNPQGLMMKGASGALYYDGSAWGLAAIFFVTQAAHHQCKVLIAP
ncbi:MAG: hypothetical protein Q8R44_19895 [Novosphingobium sp.]|nr:hypothetical protein [Novosphingobium sp.]